MFISEMPKIIVIVWLLPVLIFSQEVADNIDSDILEKSWDARWITHPTASVNDYGVFHFRKDFKVDSIPDSFIIHVSADNRYRLFVNGKSISFGPAKGDPMHWRFESIDISSQLEQGKNIIAAEVWNFGEDRPVSQMSRQTGFILNSEDEGGLDIDTDQSWKVYKNPAYSPINDFSYLNTYIVVGPGDKIQGEKYPWGWQTKKFEDSNWKSPKLLEYGKPRGTGAGMNWALTSRKIPLMTEKKQRLEKVRRTDNIEITNDFLAEENSIEISRNTKVSFLLDQTEIVTAFPQLLISGGVDSKIKLTYSEALYDCEGKKSNRDTVRGKEIKGVYDVIFPDGGRKRHYRTLWFRTYRYLKVEIETDDDPLILHDLYGKYTAYPFEQKGKFSSSDERLDEIWKIGWRTAKLCAHETYYDCPYYEQLQYTGDTRIQALISLYVSGDARLMKKAINDFQHSMVSEGLTQSRYPSRTPQFIPAYSLFWVSMLHDYWMHKPNQEFVEEKLYNIENILRWHKRNIGSNGMMKSPQWWNFVDWAKPWSWSRESYLGGEPKGGSQGYSSILNLQYVYVLNQAVDLFENFGKDDLADKYKELANRISESVYKHCWDNEKGLIAETPEKDEFSQHANIMALLSGMFKEEREKRVMERILKDKSLIKTTMYYRFYLFRALDKVGMESKLFSELEHWHNMIDKGLSTFAEKPDPTRSDCHAWSASPTYEFLATVCGIKPAAPGFEKVLVEPNLGDLSKVKGSVQHPEGKIKVNLKKSTDSTEAQIVLPEDVSGKFIWQEEEYNLQEGNNNFQF